MTMREKHLAKQTLAVAGDRWPAHHAPPTTELPWPAALPGVFRGLPRRKPQVPGGLLVPDSPHGRAAVLGLCLKFSHKTANPFLLVLLSVLLENCQLPSLEI